MKIAIIGCGYVGTAFARYCRQELGFVVTATTTTAEKVSTLNKVADRVVILKGSDKDSLYSVVQGQDAVLMCVGAWRSDYRDTYLCTAENLVAILRQTPGVKSLIYTSSCSVYGDHKGKVVKENNPIVPGDDKHQILAHTEEVLLSATSDNLRVCILRLAGIYGAGRELVKIYSRVPGKTLPGDGSEPSNWIHLDDIVGAIALACQQQLQGIYNLVNDAQLTRREVIDTVLAKQNLPPVIWDSSKSSPRSYNARLSNQKIKEVGYQLIHPQIF